MRCELNYGKAPKNMEDYGKVPKKIWKIVTKNAESGCIE